VTVTFAPGQFSRFFRVTALQLTDTTVGLGSLWGKSALHLEERIVNESTESEIAELLDEVFLSRLSSRSYAHDAATSLVVHLISRRKGRISVDDLAGCAGVSRRHLERRFADTIGLTPKRMCRRARFQNTFSRITTYAGLDWATLAYANEYSDQAHLIRECKFFTAYSPLKYLNNRSSPDTSVMCTVSTAPV
jgi:AraC-like DNA-binding protein